MDGVGDAADHLGVSEPWHVPALPSDAPADEVPPEVIDAAKRALRARRPDVGVLDVVEQSTDPTDGGSQFRFSDGSVSVEVRSRPQDSSFALHIRSPQYAGSRVEVLHGGPTAEVALDDEGVGDVEVSAGPLSLVLHSAYPSVPPAQTFWVRLP